MARTSTADRLRNPDNATDRVALKIVRAVVKKPGVTREQLRFAFDARPGELAPAFRAAGPLLRFHRVGHTAEVTPTEQAIQLVRGARKGPRSASSTIAAAARKVGGAR